MVTAWRRALVAEVCWLAPEERPEGFPATPLVLDDMPCIALPYSRRNAALALGAVTEVAFAVTDARTLSSGARGIAAVGTATAVDDLDGSLFTSKLLDQELVKYPPSRTLSDSLLLRHENWWWLPRVIVRLDRVDRLVELPARTDPAAEAVLVRNGTGLRIDTVRGDDWDRERVHVPALSGDPLRGDGAPALALAHDYALPDLERWEPWTVRGELLGDQLVIDERHGEREGSLRPLRLLERIRRQRALEKACSRAIADAEREAR